ncbi:hypothetical protein LSUE1_G005844, partial [Lachnellula suecica]
IRYSRHLQQYTSDTSPPALLHACAESRHLFLSIYENFTLSKNILSAVFIDFSRDTLFFDHMDCSPEGDLARDLATSPQSQKILYLAIDAHLWEVLRVFKHENLTEVKSLRNLKMLALVLRQDYDRGLRETRMMSDGREITHVDVSESMPASEIQHVYFNVDSIRWDLEHDEDPQWEGEPPNVQMWIL